LKGQHLFAVLAASQGKGTPSLWLLGDGAEHAQLQTHHAPLICLAGMN